MERFHLCSSVRFLYKIGKLAVSVGMRGAAGLFRLAGGCPVLSAGKSES